MRYTKDWIDYELLDSSSGERLEKWGNVTLIRPDPQVIWKTEKKHPGWTRADARYHRSEKGGGHWEVYNHFPEEWNIRYKDLTFLIRPMGFKHTGLFPEQAVNWDYLRQVIRESGRKDVKVLNLFAYTGGATVAALAEGASVVHVDASKGMVQYAKENAKLCGLSDRPVRWLTDDCRKFVNREIRREHEYDIIIMDPPSYGRGTGGEVWKLEDMIYDFVELTGKVLSKKPLMVLINSYTTGLSPSVMQYILGSIIVPKFGGTVTSSEIGLPTAQSGMCLPCGASAIWIAEGVTAPTGETV